MSMNREAVEPRPEKDRFRRLFGWVDEETGEFTPDKGRTKQEFADSTDINNIINLVMKTGDTKWMEDHKAWVENAQDIALPNVDYKEIMDIVSAGESRFADLPSSVRKLFGNDTAVFLDYCQDEPDSLEKLQAMITEAKQPVTKAGSALVGSDPGPDPIVEPVVEPGQ